VSELTPLSDALLAWLPTQRWFGGKNRELSEVSTRDAVTLLEGDPRLVHAVLRTSDGEYQLLVGRRRELPEHLEHAKIGEVDGYVYYEAVHDTELMGKLLELIAEDTWVGPLHFAPEPGAVVVPHQRAKPVSAEQSNTSVVYGTEYILKLFRRVVAGPNPDLQLHRALQSVGSKHIARPLGAITDEFVVLGILQEFLLGAAEGWAMATASVRDLMAEGDLHAAEVGGDFAGEAFRLGQAVAEVHADLRKALGSGQEGPERLYGAVQAMHQRLDTVLAEVPELAPYESALRAAFEQARGGPALVEVQFIHGDLHLGQVLRTATGWKLIDFEGEPAAPLAERNALRSPLRDVAGMLRSFDYAAQQLLVGHPADHQLEVRAREWTARNREAFCDGYAEVGDDPRSQGPLLRALELDKAVYEVAYEHGNRPDWLTVPLASIARITAGED
jgi:maltokinase